MVVTTVDTGHGYGYGRYVRGALAVASRVLELVCFGSKLKLQLSCVWMLDPVNHFLLLGKGESIQSALAQALAFLGTGHSFYICMMYHIRSRIRRRPLSCRPTCYLIPIASPTSHTHSPPSYSGCSLYPCAMVLPSLQLYRLSHVSSGRRFVSALWDPSSYSYTGSSRSSVTYLAELEERGCWVVTLTASESTYATANVAVALPPSWRDCTRRNRPE